MLLYRFWLDVRGFFFEQKTAYDMRISDWSADVCSSDLVDMDVAWMASRWDKVGPIGDGKDYINCPMDKEQYHAFVQGLVDGDKTDFKDWEKDTPYFEGCMPIEEIGRASCRERVCQYV